MLGLSVLTPPPPTNNTKARKNQIRSRFNCFQKSRSILLRFQTLKKKKKKKKREREKKKKKDVYIVQISVHVLTSPCNVYEHEPANNNNNNMRFCVLFLEIGAHGPLQSKEPKHSQNKPPFPNTSSERKKSELKVEKPNKSDKTQTHKMFKRTLFISR